MTLLTVPKGEFPRTPVVASSSLIGTGVSRNRWDRRSNGRRCEPRRSGTTRPDTNSVGVVRGGIESARVRHYGRTFFVEIRLSYRQIVTGTRVPVAIHFDAVTFISFARNVAIVRKDQFAPSQSVRRTTRAKKPNWAAPTDRSRLGMITNRPVRVSSSVSVPMNAPATDIRRSVTAAIVPLRKRRNSFFPLSNRTSSDSDTPGTATDRRKSSFSSGELSVIVSS